MITRARRLLGPCLLLTALASCAGDSSARTEEDELRAELARNPLFRPKSLITAAPDTFHVRLRTTKGPVVVRVVRAWAPHGADRFYNLVEADYYDGVRFHRVLEDFVAEFGIHGDPRVNAVWQDEVIPDDPVAIPNARGHISFAKSGPNSRTTQVFINLKDNPGLDEQGFAPFGAVVEGMDVVDLLYAEYGDGPPRGEGVYKAMAAARGDAYFEEEFPELDRVESAEVVSGG